MVAAATGVVVGAPGATGGAGPAGLGGGWDVREMAGSGLNPRFQPRCWARVVVVVAPFPGTGDVGYGPGVGERCWLQLCAL